MPSEPINFYHQVFFTFVNTLGLDGASLDCTESYCWLYVHLGDIHYFDVWFRIGDILGTFVTGETKQPCSNSPLAVYYVDFLRLCWMSD